MVSAAGAVSARPLGLKYLHRYAILAVALAPTVSLRRQDHAALSPHIHLNPLNLPNTIAWLQETDTLLNKKSGESY